MTTQTGEFQPLEFWLNCSSMERTFLFGIKFEKSFFNLDFVESFHRNKNKTKYHYFMVQRYNLQVWTSKNNKHVVTMIFILNFNSFQYDVRTLNDSLVNSTEWFYFQKVNIFRFFIYRLFFVYFELSNIRMQIKSTKE